MMMPTTTHRDGTLDHAIAACDRIERGMHDAAGRAQHALRQASLELKRMMDQINADRPARGEPALDIEITVPGAS
jgi:hypothetical protein